MNKVIENNSVNILLVEDDPVSSKAMELQLLKVGIHCSTVPSGEACLDFIKERCVDLILLDIILPKMSGLEVLTKIRADKQSFELPVIMVTSKGETGDIINALQSGANDYIAKPANIEVSVARIKTQIQIKRLIESSLDDEKKETINKMITTLNHQINNPLAIALGNLSLIKSPSEPIKIEKSIQALNRISEIVQKIDKVSAQDDIEEINYSSQNNMFKI